VAAWSWRTAPNYPAAIRRRRSPLVRGAAAAALALVATLVIGNVTIAAASAFTKWRTPARAVPGVVSGVKNLATVDPKVWRGAAPGEDGLRSLAAAGVTTVVDLRAEPEATHDDDLARALGMEVVHLPIRDGQTPSSEQIGRFLATVAEAPGTVFVHCGAGVGRTGVMAAAYLLATGEVGRAETIRRNLAVGPPSLEQLAFAAEGGRRPGVLLTSVSRFLDSPRRLWSRYGL
jgi:protein tyrosine phosphatase (PTP) superfamily phosphohydrolase (DUF442 family)